MQRFTWWLSTSSLVNLQSIPLSRIHRFFHPGKKLEDICPSTHNMEVPNVKRKDYQLIGMEDDFLSLMEDTGETRDDLKCPGEENEVGNEIRAAIDNESEILVRLLLSVCRICE